MTLTGSSFALLLMTYEPIRRAIFYRFQLSYSKFPLLGFETIIRNQLTVLIFKPDEFSVGHSTTVNAIIASVGFALHYIPSPFAEFQLLLIVKM